MLKAWHEIWFAKLLFIKGPIPTLEQSQKTYFQMISFVSVHLVLFIILFMYLEGCCCFFLFFYMWPTSSTFILSLNVGLPSELCLSPCTEGSVCGSLGSSEHSAEHWWRRWKHDDGEEGRGAELLWGQSIQQGADSTRSVPVHEKAKITRDYKNSIVHSQYKEFQENEVKTVM